MEMKMTLFAFSLLLLLTEAGRIPLIPCTCNSDCSKDECCLLNKRGTSYYCRKRLRKGSTCYLSTNHAKDEKFDAHCPCMDPYECRAERIGFDYYGRYVYELTKCAEIIIEMQKTTEDE